MLNRANLQGLSVSPTETLLETKMRQVFSHESFHKFHRNTTTFVLQVQLFIFQVCQLKFKLGKIIVSSVQGQRTEGQVQPKISSSILTFPD